jgi:hypothetical protein
MGGIGVGKTGMQQLVWGAPLLLLSACNQAASLQDAGLSLEPSGSDAVAQPDPLDASVDAEPWRVVFDDLEHPVLSVWLLNDEHAFFVGERGLLLELRDGQWARWAVPTEATLWWVWGTSAENVYAGGESGTLLHFDGARWLNVDAGLDPEETVWGIWGANASDIWLVGGRARSNGPGFAVRGNAERWARVETGLTLPNLFKVWGRSPSDLFLVGDQATLLHCDGALFLAESLDLSEFGGPLNEPLFTVAGNTAGTVVAVGGINQGLVFELGSGGFHNVPLFSSGFNGVSVSSSDEVYVVGLFGAIQRRADGEWRDESTQLGRHYHAVAALSSGSAFAVGGDLLADRDARRGLIMARGAAFSGSVGELLQRGSDTTDAGAAVHDGAAVYDAAVASDNETELGSEQSAPTAPPTASSDAGTFASLLDASSVPSPFQDASVAPDSGSEVTADPADAATSSASSSSGDTACESSGCGDTTEADGLPGPGELCNATQQCGPGLECWYVQGDSVLRCVVPCNDAAECVADFGAEARCAPAGCQTSTPVCLRAEWQACL